MVGRRRRKDSRRRRKRAQAQAGDARRPFLETPAGRLVTIALAIVALWLVVLAVYIAGR